MMRFWVRGDKEFINFCFNDVVVFSDLFKVLMKLSLIVMFLVLVGFGNKMDIKEWLLLKKCLRFLRFVFR